MFVSSTFHLLGTDKISTVLKILSVLEKGWPLDWDICIVVRFSNFSNIYFQKEISILHNQKSLQLCILWIFQYKSNDSKKNKRSVNYAYVIYCFRACDQEDGKGHVPLWVVVLQSLGPPPPSPVHSYFYLNKTTIRAKRLKFSNHILIFSCMFYIHSYTNKMKC